MQCNDFFTSAYNAPSYHHILQLYPYMMKQKIQLVIHSNYLLGCSAIWLHGITSEKIVLFIITAVRTSNPTQTWLL